MVHNEAQVYAAGSEATDTLIFSAPVLYRDFTFSEAKERAELFTATPKTSAEKAPSKNGKRRDDKGKGMKLKVGHGPACLMGW